tara:strand:- start:1205 stop:1528 length:324 start_codon:yes stop_codon:yes gene_type:complete
MISSDFPQGIYLMITTELDKKNAYKIANLLLREKLIPCITFKNIESHFWWEGEINQSKEIQLIMKCKEENINDVYKKISENHSYKVPEIIYFPVSVNKDYFQWLYSI